MATMTVSLPEEEWVRVLNMLATFPFKDVASTLQQIQQQLQMQIEQNKQPTSIPMKGNGQVVDGHGKAVNAPGA